MKHKFLFLGTWGFLSTTLFSCADVKKNSQELTVCSVSANPEHFSGKIITVSGRLESDGIERTTLMDEGCEGTGIAISAPTHFKGKRGSRKHSKKVIRVRWIRELLELWLGSSNGIHKRYHRNDFGA